MKLNVFWQEVEETFQLEAFDQLLSLHFYNEHILLFLHVTPYSAYIIQIMCRLSSCLTSIYILHLLLYRKKHTSCCFRMLNISALSIASNGNTIKFLIKFCYRFETYELRIIIIIIIKRNRKGSKVDEGIKKKKVDFILSFIIAIIIDSR